MMCTVQCMMLLTLDNIALLAIALGSSAVFIVHCSLFIIHCFYVGHLARHIARRSLTEWLLVSFLLFTGSVIFTGFVLSALFLTANVWAWAIAVFLTSTVLGWVLRQLVRSAYQLPAFRSATTPTHPAAPGLHPHALLIQTDYFSIGQLTSERWRDARQWFAGLSPFLKLVFGAMLITLTITATTNLLLVLFTVPNEWDSMTGHLNRVVQYMQRGSMRHFGGTNWNIDTYPKSVCTIQIYSYLLTGRFENAFKLIHHLSYWTAIVAVFGIVQRITKGVLSAAVFCALVYALLPDFLMQAITTETDIVLTAYLSVLLYMLFTFHETKDNRYLWLAGIAFGLAFGHKITFALLLPSVFMVMVYTVFWSDSLKTTFARIWKLGVTIVVAMCFWTFPTGYLKNIEAFGHPIGPPTALKHQSVERAGSFKNLIVQGSRNFIRYGYDHANLDGIRSTATGVAINKAIRTPLVVLEDKLHLGLDEVTEFSIQPFSFDRRFIFYNANPYWGIFGFGLILPFVILLLVFLLRSGPMLTLALALVLHFAALSFSAPYDPFKGRYFIETGLFGAPLLALLFTNRWVSVALPGRVVWKIYVGLVVIVGCTSAVMTVFLNTRALPFAWRGPNGTAYPSAFEADRIKMMTIGRPDTYRAYLTFDQVVPQTATVALGTINDDYEYPLYGPRLSRRLIAINPFERGLQPIPTEANYLFFSKNVIKPKPGDLRLGTDTTMTEGVVVRGEDYYLRKLK